MAQPLFAAPEAAASLPAGTAGGIGQATLALLLVLAAIFAIAWLARRLRNVTRGGTQGIEVLAQAAVGPRERVVVVRVGEARLLLGVAPGRVSRLHELPPEAQLPTQAPSQGTGGTQPPASLVQTFRALMQKGGRP